MQILDFEREVLCRSRQFRWTSAGRLAGSVRGSTCFQVIASLHPLGKGRGLLRPLKGKRAVPQGALYILRSNALTWARYENGL